MPAGFPWRTHTCKYRSRRNSNLLRAVVEVYPDRTASGPVVAAAVGLLDIYYEGAILHWGKDAESSDGKRLPSYSDVLNDVAYSIKLLSQRLRRLFRRSHQSRSQKVHNLKTYCELRSKKRALRDTDCSVADGVDLWALILAEDAEADAEVSKRPLNNSASNLCFFRGFLIRPPRPD